MPNNFPNGLDPKRNLASTYQEVLKFKEYLNDELIPLIEILKNAFFGKDDGSNIGKGDVIIDDNGDARVPGITVIVNNTYVQSAPNDYDRDITFEIKDKEVINLPVTEPGNGTVINNTYVTVMTVHIHNVINNPDGSVSGYYPAWQIAYGDENGHLYLYYRKSIEDSNTWGPWNKVFDLEVMLELNPEIVEKFSHRQIVEKDILPVGQEIGDYWFWPIQKGVDPVASGSGITDITDIEWPDIPDGYFFQSLDNPDEKYLCPDENSRFVFVDPNSGSMLLPPKGSYDTIPDIFDPNPGYVGYYAVDLDNPSVHYYFDDDEIQLCGLYIVGAIYDDADQKPIDPLDPDNDGIYTGKDPVYRPGITDGSGTGVSDPNKGTDPNYPYDPDGQKPGDKVGDDITDDIIIIDRETGEEIDPIMSKTRDYYMINLENESEATQLNSPEFKRYSLMEMPGGTMIDPVKFKDMELVVTGKSTIPD